MMIRRCPGCGAPIRRRAHAADVYDCGACSASFRIVIIKRKIDNGNKSKAL